VERWNWQEAAGRDTAANRPIEGPAAKSLELSLLRAAAQRNNVDKGHQGAKTAPSSSLTLKDGVSTEQNFIFSLSSLIYLVSICIVVVYCNKLYKKKSIDELYEPKTWVGSTMIDRPFCFDLKMGSPKILALPAATCRLRRHVSLFGCSPARQHAAQAAIVTPGHQNRTPEHAAWARQLCQGTKQTSFDNTGSSYLLGAQGL